VVTAEECRRHSAECQRLAEQTSNARVKAILLDMAGTWTRLALEAEQWSQERSPKQRLTKKATAKIGSRSFPPILLRVPLHRGGLGVLRLEPVWPPGAGFKSQPRLDLQLRSIHRHGLRQCFIVLRRAYELFTRFETGHRSSTPSSAGVKISRPASFPSHGVNWSGSSTTGMRS
jgi:hypothetical protein